MQERGVVIRQQLPDLLRADGARLSDALGVSLDELGVEGRDGTGLKSEVPWVRVFGREQSPSSTIGWYVVYLFSASGQRVYLSLNQGTTIWTGGVFKPRRLEDLQARAVGHGRSWQKPRPRGQTCTRRSNWTAGPLWAAATDPGMSWPSRMTGNGCPRRGPCWTTCIS
ncbi:DUF3578 domain-containing protein [Streptomyces sp. NPDC048643]|uniref:MrcB family domain-containing protein n=1 Tax=Streptomyces sp. NPDC048643 TaxID=3155637 RepID=UPI003442143D